MTRLRKRMLEELQRRNYPYSEIDLVYPKRAERLPVILSEEEVARLNLTVDEGTASPITLIYNWKPKP